MLTAMNLPADRARASIRFSLGKQNTAEEVDFAISIVPETVAQLVTCRSAATPIETTSSTVDDVPAESTVLRVHVTRLPAAPQLHPVPLADTNVSPAGGASVTMTLSATEGPSFVIVLGVDHRAAGCRGGRSRLGDPHVRALHERGVFWLGVVGRDRIRLRGAHGGHVGEQAR